MHVRFLTIVVIAILSSLSAKSQSNSCLDDFDYLVKKIHANYPGYNDKITDKTLPKLVELESKIRQKILEFPDSCGYYMNEYTLFFKDYHLRVRRVRSKSEGENTQTEIMAFSTYGKNIKLNLDSLHKATANTSKIEGIWIGFRDEFAILKQGNQKYAAVAIKSQDWQPGQVMSEFEAINDSVFNVINFSLVKGDKTYDTKASLHLNGKIMEIHNETRFVRKTDSDIINKATLYSYVPRYPNGSNTYPLAIYLNDSTYYIRIPGFHDNGSNEIVQKHWNEITSRPNLIIDIRNNGGGLDDYYQELAKLIYTKPYESKGVEWYASEGNIKLFEDAVTSGEIRNGEEGIKWTNDLINAMKKNIGGFVTHPNNINDDQLVERDTIYPMPRKVGIIINDGNASSAEQFLLDAKESDKVVLFGNCNTAGILDYSNITPIPLPSGNYQLWCPMTRSKRLPENPIDNIGIASDVIIPFPATEQLYDKLDNWVYFVKNYLEIMK